MEEEREVCQVCGEAHDDMIYIEDYGWVCQECYDNTGDFYYCDYCQQYFHSPDVEYYTTHDGETVCQYCRDNHYYYCEHCDELFYEDNINYHEGHDAYYCNSCYPEEPYNIHEYHDYADLHLLGEGEEDALRFGLEIEVNAPSKSYNQLDDDAGEVASLLGEVLYDIQSDGSIPNGYEIITQPMTWEYYQKTGKEKLTNALDYLKDEYYQQLCDGCGVHIHFTKAPVERANSKYYEELNYILETFDEKFKRVANRDTLYDGGYLGDKIKTGKKVDWSKMVNELDKIKTRRYQPINITPSHTFEWRIFRGTTDIDILDKYVRLAYNTTMSVVNNAFIGKTFSEITGINDDDKTRLSGIARQLRYEKLIDAVYKDALTYVLSNLTILRDAEQQNIKYSTTVNKREFYYTVENGKYRTFNETLKTVIGRCNGSSSRITINKLIELIANLDNWDTRAIYNDFKNELEVYRARIKELQEARDNYGQKLVENKLKVVDYSKIVKGTVVTFKPSEWIIDYCREHHFGIDIGVVNALGNNKFEVYNITSFDGLTSVDIGMQVLPLECIKSIVKEGV